MMMMMVGWMGGARIARSFPLAQPLFAFFSSSCEVQIDLGSTVVGWHDVCSWRRRGQWSLAGVVCLMWLCTFPGKYKWPRLDSSWIQKAPIVSLISVIYYYITQSRPDHHLKHQPFSNPCTKQHSLTPSIDKTKNQNLGLEETQTAFQDADRRQAHPGTRRPQQRGALRCHARP